MKKAFDFVASLKPDFFSVLGFPTLKVYSDFVEVYFDSSATIRDLEIFNVSSDEFRFFPNDGVITYVFTFYNAVGWFMEVAVYMSLDARAHNKPIFKRVVLCPDAFEYDSFVRVMRSVFGDKAVIEFIVV